jgi:hypothetical protein
MEQKDFQIGELRYKFSRSLTQGAVMRDVLMKSSALAVCSTVFAIPYFHHLIFLSPMMAPLPLSLGLRGFLLMELLILFIICLLSSIVGFSFYQRHGLPGFGDKNQFVKSIPLLLLLGALITILSYLLFDRYFIKLSPSSYPKNLLYIVSFPLKAAFTEEVILRFSLVTIGVGIFRSRAAGVVLAAAVASLFTLKYFQFVGISVGFDYLIITQLLISFTANLVLGYLFVTQGLLYAMALNFLFGMKYLVISLLSSL